MMWSPIIVTPPVWSRASAGIFSRRWAKTYLPITAAIYTAQRADRRVLPRPRRGAAARAASPGQLQHPDGAADHGPGPDVDRRRDGAARRRRCAARTEPGAGQARPIRAGSPAQPATRSASRHIRRGCRGNASGRRPQMIGRYPDYDVLASADTWDPATRGGRHQATAPPRPVCGSSRRQEEPTLHGRSATS